jgi:hypothetical protein
MAIRPYIWIIRSSRMMTFWLNPLLVPHTLGDTRIFRGHP